MTKDRAFYRTIVRLSLPAAFQAALSLITIMVDNQMVTAIDGQGIAFAAVAQTNAVTNFINALLMGLAGGSIVLISQYWGRRDLDRLRQVAAVAVTSCLSVAAFAIVLLRLLPREVLSLVIKPDEHQITAEAMKYLAIVCFSYLPLSVSVALTGILKGVEVVKVTLYAAALSLVSNISLNYVFIFGHLGMPALGVEGAALATVIARVLEALLIGWFFFKRQKAVEIRPGRLIGGQGWAWKDYGRFGLPVGLTDAQWALVGLIKMMIIGHLGAIMIGATAITDMLMNLGTMFTFALAGGAAVMIGKAVGEGDMVKVRAYANTIQVMFLALGVVMAGLVFVLAKPFVSLYPVRPEMAELAVKMISICALTLIGTSYHASCFIGINRGAGDSRFVMLVDMICGWLIVLPAAYVSAYLLKLPLHWVYFVTRIDQCFKWLIAYLRLRGDRWIHVVTRSDSHA